MIASEMTGQVLPVLASLGFRPLQKDVHFCEGRVVTITSKTPELFPKPCYDRHPLNPNYLLLPTFRIKSSQERINRTFS